MTNEEQTARDVFRRVFGQEPERGHSNDGGVSYVSDNNSIVIVSPETSWRLAAIRIDGCITAPTLAEAAALATQDTIPRARVVEAMRGVAVTWQWSGTATECARDIAAALNIPWSEVEP